jgi:hypothetical protein
MSQRGRLASDVLTTKLLELARRGVRVRCSDGEVSHYWTSDHEGERKLAALWCTGCPALTECFNAAKANRETWLIYGGVDFSRTPGAKRKDIAA